MPLPLIEKSTAFQQVVKPCPSHSVLIATAESQRWSACATQNQKRNPEFFLLPVETPQL